jgi:hypothetical protein
MCRRISLLGLVLCLFALPADAQQRDAVRQRAVIDSLLPQVAAARSAMIRADSLERAARMTVDGEPLDTAIVQSLTIIAPRSQFNETVAAFQIAAARAQELLSGLPRDRRLVLAVEWQIKPHSGLQALARREGLRSVAIYGGTRARRAQSVEAALADAVLPLMPDSMRAWLQDQIWSRGVETDNVHRQLATSPAPDAGACLRNDMNACARALGLAPQRDALQGYSREHVRALAKARLNPYENGALWRACVGGGDTEACMHYIKQTGGLPPALPPFGRANFLMYALERGGPGALARLISPEHANAAAAIAAAGKQPLPVLINGWRQNIEAQRAVSYAGLSKGILAALLWSIAAAFVAMRSTRRRAE